MALHPALQHLIETKLEHAHAPQWMLPIAEVRHNFRALWTREMTGEPLPVDRVEDLSIPVAAAPIPARLYAPDRRKAYPLLVYLHGGGYVKGGLDESDTFCRNLSAVARHVVLSVDYRLAPEHPFPAALDDARGRGLTVVPECPFVISYLRRHPDELDVVDERHRALILRG